MFCVDPMAPYWLFAVFDGAGGNFHPRAASQAAKNTVLTHVRGYQPASPQDLSPLVAEALKAANQAVYQIGLARNCTAQVITTAVVAILFQGYLCVGHIGDSRAYLLQDEKILRLTTDHNLFEQEKRAGIYSEKNGILYNERLKRTLSRALGMESQLALSDEDISVTRLSATARILLCTDGLLSLEDEEIRKIASTSDPDSACCELICKARLFGSEDDITALVSHIHPNG